MSTKRAVQEALALHACGRRDEALTRMRALHRSDPADVELQFCLGAMCAEAGEVAAAREHLAVVVAARPDHFGATAGLAELHEAAGDAPTAVDLWRGFVAAAPRDIRGRLQLIRALLAAADRGAADREAERLLAAGDEAELLLAVAQIYHAAGLEDAAIPRYRECLALRPGYAPARQSLAAALHAQGDLDAAEPLYRRLLEDEPANLEVLANLATLRKERGDLGEALTLYEQAMRLRRRRLTEAEVAKAGRDPALRRTTLHSLRLEREQLDYLCSAGIGVVDAERLLAGYDDVIAALEAANVGGRRTALSEAQFARIGTVMQRLVHVQYCPALKGGALNPSLDFDAIETRYRDSDPGIVVVDDFLRPEALAALRDYCQRSTIWFGYGKRHGYCGAYLQDGFGNPLLLQLARELGARLPSIIGPHRLNQMWGYIYDQRMRGITAHADPAAVNLNFWIVPDDANLEPDRGGLVIAKREAPLEWDFQAYNNRPEVLEAYMAESEQLRVPYRCNRLVMFNSNLVHKTDAFSFRPGFTNRRINITMLFGERARS